MQRNIDRYKCIIQSNIDRYNGVFLNRTIVVQFIASKAVITPPISTLGVKSTITQERRIADRL